MPSAGIKKELKYQKIAEEIRKSILKEAVPENTKILSVREIMRQFQVSNWTAQKVMHQLAEKGIVKGFHGRGTFVEKKSNRTKREYTVGCTIRPVNSDLTENALFGNIDERIYSDLKHSGIHLRKIPIEAFPAEAGEVSRYLDGLDALLISGVAINLAQCMYLADMNLPPTLIFHGEYLLELPFHQVIPDHMTGMRKMFREAGNCNLHEVFIITGGSTNEYYREQACIRAAANSGFTVSQTVKLQRSSNIYKWGYQNAALLAGKLIFSTSDFLTFPLLKALRDKKLKESIDFHLVSYDNIEGLGVHPCADLTVTSICYNPNLMIELTIAQLHHILKQNFQYQEIRMIPTELIIRKSAFYQINRKDTLK